MDFLIFWRDPILKILVNDWSLQSHQNHKQKTFLYKLPIYDDHHAVVLFKAPAWWQRQGYERSNYNLFLRKLLKEAAENAHPGGNLGDKMSCFPYSLKKPLKLEEKRVWASYIFSACFLLCVPVWSLKKFSKSLGIGYIHDWVIWFMFKQIWREEVEIGVSKSVQDYRILQALKAFKLLGRLPEMHKWTFWAEGFSDLDVLILNGPLIGD